MKRLVLFVEGPGDHDAAPVLVNRVKDGLPPELQTAIFVDPDPFKVGNINCLTGPRRGEWPRFLSAAGRSRKNLGGVLLLLDGDRDQVEGKSFCATKVARLLADRAAGVGAGKTFSVAIVFLRKEYETLLIAVANQLPGLKADSSLPPTMDEDRLGGKGWLARCLVDGYRAMQDQARLTRSVNDWTPARSLRCFRRLERAVFEIAQAVVTGQNIATPGPPMVAPTSGI